MTFENSKVTLFSALLLAVCLTQVAADIYAPALIAITTVICVSLVRSVYDQVALINK